MEIESIGLEAGSIRPDQPASRPLWMRVALWPLKTMLAMLRSMVLFILVVGLPFVVLMRKLSLVWLVLAVAAFSAEVPTMHAVLMLAAAAFFWLAMDAWNWLLYRLLPQDEVLIAPYH